MNSKFKMGITLFLIGFMGVLTLLSVSIPLENIPKEVLDKISPQTLKYLVIINPSIFLLISVLIGTFLYTKVDLNIPTLSALLKIKSVNIPFIEQLKFGIILGLLTGILTTFVGIIFKSSIPQEFLDLGNKISITPLARFGYGGFTEEILMRFGFMTLVVWIVFKISKSLNNSTYWVGIVLSSILFAIGHFPIVFSTIETPSLPLLTYILIGNSIAGLFFGWLYWKKGLESAFIAHIFAHIAMLIGEKFSN